MTADTKALTIFRGDTLSKASDLSEKLKTCRIIPDALRGSPADILAIVLAGEEMGVGPMAAIRGISLIKGKPSIGADLMVALVHRSGHCKFFRLVESTEKLATYETHRHGNPEPNRMTYTIEEAKKAGVTSKDVWKNYPAAMIRARCSSALARAVYQDVLFGVYEHDELSHATPADVIDAEVVDEPDAIDEARSIAKEIADATTVDELDALSVKIRGMSAYIRGELRPVYTTRLAELKATEPAPPGQGPGVADAQAERDESWMNEPGDDPESDIPR